MGARRVTQRASSYHGLHAPFTEDKAWRSPFMCNQLVTHRPLH